MTPRITEALWPESWQAIAQLRREVFILEQQVPEDLEWDDADAQARHFCLWLEADLAAYGRLVLPEAGKGKLTRMAVRREWRRQGLGGALLRHVITQAVGLRLQYLVLDAQLAAVPFYQRQGFVAWGEVFMDAGIEHVAMTLQLAPV
ncbi:MAG: hypothetical protein RL497_778 [Pseudomonadota bacterium]|jgi:predicted GNAT family N-acyltransferase